MSNNFEMPEQHPGYMKKVEKIKVCSGCGIALQATDLNGNPACAICAGIEEKSGIPKEVRLPETFRCSSCGKVWETKDILKVWKFPPFANPEKGTFYDGCYGWD